MLLAEFTYPGHHPLAGRQGVVFGFAVRLDEGVALIDTGVGYGDHSVDEHYRPSRRSIREALQEVGCDDSEVRLIINSHLHFDHCGQNREFPGVPIYAQHAEYEASQSAGYTVREWVDFPGARFELLNGDADVGNGIHVLSTPGHTLGHQAVIVTTDAGPVALVGHAFTDSSEFSRGMADADRSPQERTSALRVLEINPRRVYFGHDRSVWNRRYI